MFFLHENLLTSLEILLLEKQLDFGCENQRLALFLLKRALLNVLNRHSILIVDHGVFDFLPFWLVFLKEFGVSGD